MPAAQRKDWEAHVVHLKNEHSRINPGVPWRQGLALNAEIFLAWGEGYAARHEDEKPAEASSMFLVAGKEARQGDVECLLHPNVSTHVTSTCRELSRISTARWYEICKARKRCVWCLAPYSISHRSVCKAKCNLCGGKHLMKRCGKDLPSHSSYTPHSSYAPRSSYKPRRRPHDSFEEPPQKRRKMEDFGSVVDEIKKSVTTAIVAAMPSSSSAAPAPVPPVKPRPSRRREAETRSKKIRKTRSPQRKDKLRM